MNTAILLGPEHLYSGTRMISAPDTQPLAVEYNKALANVLELLDDQELARLSVNLCGKLGRLPAGTYDGPTSTARLKVETEAIERWNRRKGGNVWLDCILRSALFLSEGP
jgi:hypothetical protein